MNAQMFMTMLLLEFLLLSFIPLENDIAGERGEISPQKVCVLVNGDVQYFKGPKQNPTKLAQ